MKDIWPAYAAGVATGILFGALGALAVRAADHTPDMTRLRATPQSQVCPDGILGTDIKGTVWCIQGVGR